MDKRRIGKSSLEVTVGGFGAWGIGGGLWVGGSELEARKAVEGYIALGGTFIDTAYVYGEGKSEKIIGDALASLNRPDIVVASKVPSMTRQWPIGDDVPFSKAFNRDQVFRMTEESLKRLKRDFLHLQQFHVWTDAWAEDEAWMRIADDLKSQGLAKLVGISVNSHQPNNCLASLRKGLLDCVQVIYNVFEQAPEDKLFPLAMEIGVGIIARVPLATGALTGSVGLDTTFPEGDFRNRKFTPERRQELVRRLPMLQELADRAHCGLSELALRFAMSHQAVSTVIPGMRSAEHVKRNLDAFENGFLSPDILLRLSKQRWDGNGL